MNIPTVKECVSDNKEAYFWYYVNGEMWYCIDLEEVIGNKCFYFPIPISDLGNTKICRTESALLLMRYIRKHIDTLRAALAL